MVVLYFSNHIFPFNSNICLLQNTFRSMVVSNVFLDQLFNYTFIQPVKEHKKEKFNIDYPSYISARIF
jgi:hypothetical protein